MRIRRLATHVEVQAPAKINLFLEVLAKRPDGFHELETVIVAVRLYDTLIFQGTEEGVIDLESRWGLGHSAAEMAAARHIVASSDRLYGDIPCGPENLVWRAAEKLRAAAGVQGGAKIQLIKRIPAAAGLGGASSDAAATLVAGNEAWNLQWPRQRLAELAAELGSDVPFFLTRGAAVCRGRGERIEPLRGATLHTVIVRPPVGLGTPQVFQRCTPVAHPETSAELVAALARGDAAATGRRLCNGLQLAAGSLTPWIETLEDEFNRQGTNGHQMSGSGSSYFGLCQTARQARRVAARLRGSGSGAVQAAATVAT